jgi:uncharacterized protein (DUF433 family)
MNDEDAAALEAAGLGVGVYSVPEASRLTFVPTRRIRRWAQGYSYLRKDTKYVSPRVFQPALEPIDGQIALTFLDLLEVRFIDAFRSAGVSWKTIRKAWELAAELVGTNHPFSTKKFKTDGRRILAELVAPTRGKKRHLLDLVGKQFELATIVEHTLFEGIEFSRDNAARWWPMGTKGGVVIDPTRSFGQPIVAVEGVPTRILARSFQAEESVEVVSRWFEVSRRSVRAAVRFEERLAQAA